MSSSEKALSVTEEVVPTEGRSLSSSVIQSASSGLVLSLLCNICLYVGNLLIARGLTRDAFAEFNIVISFVSLLALIADLGLSPLFVRSFAQAEAATRHGEKDKRGTLLGTLLILRVVLSIIVCGAVWGLAPVAGYAAHTVSLMMVMLSTLFISSRLLIVRAVTEAFVKAAGKYQMVVLFALLDAAVFATAVALFSIGGLTVEHAVLVYSLCHIPGMISLILYVRSILKKNNIHLGVDLSLIKEIGIQGLPLTLSTAFLTIHNQADPLLLDKLSTSYEVSAYGASFRLMSALIFIPVVVGGVIAPHITKLITLSDHERGQKLAHQGMKLVLAFAGGVALFLMGVADVFTNVLLGSQYKDAANLIRFLGWMFVPISFATLLTEIAIAEGRMWVSAVYTAVLVTITLIGDPLLIPGYGAWGALSAKFSGIVVGCTVLLYLFRRSTVIKHSHFLQVIGKLLGAMALGAFPFYVFASHIALATVLGLAIYSVILLVSKVLRVSDFQVILRQLR